MKKLLVTGEIRSGTTFLCNLLNSQPDGIVYADFLRTMFVDGQLLGISDVDSHLTSRDANVLCSNLVAEFRMFGLDTDPDRENIKNWVDLFDFGLDEIRRIESSKKDVKYIGVKKTRETYYLHQLLQNDFKIIHIYRDPRNVLISAKNRFSNYDLYQIAYEWKKTIDSALSFRTDPNFHLVKYENLITKDPKTKDDLEAFLDANINFDLKNLTIRNGVPYRDNSSFGNVKSTFDQSALYRWKHEMDSDEVSFVHFHLAKYLELLDYEMPERNYLSGLRRHWFGLNKRRLKKMVKRVIS